MAEIQESLLADDTDNLDKFIDADLAEVSETKWKGLLAEIVAAAESGFIRKGYSESDAVNLATIAVASICFIVGGRTGYLPRGEALSTALRDHEIHRFWQQGATVEELSLRYKLTTIHTYRIIGKQRRLHLEKTQGRFNFDKEDGR